MADNFETFGLRFVTEGAKSAINDVTNFNKAVDTGTKGLGKNATASGKSASIGDKLSQVTQKLGEKFDFSKIKSGQFVSELSRMTGVGGDIAPIFSGANSVLGGFSIGIAGATAGLAAFIALGVRGAGLRGIVEGFDELAQATGQSTNVLLANLQKASTGTISNIDLMKNANLALAGASDVVAQELGKKLPQVLQVAQAQARRTGESTDFLFQSLVRGIKRSSPLLIDNTGLVVKVGEANEKYAEQIGKTVEQLTAEDKQIALLNATIEAGQSSIDALGKSQETASLKMARASATITNIMDSLSLAVQPAFEVVLDVVNFFLGAIESIITPIAKVVQFILGAFQRLWNGTIGIFTGIVNFLGSSLNGILNNLFGFKIQWDSVWTTATQLVQLAFIEMSRTVGSVMGAFVNGLMLASVRINQVIARIAQGIADFLVGSSPPPRGPLSNIDTGGANTMLAWLDGFAGVSLDPINQVTSEVDSLMGRIGELSLPQVERRLAQLDMAVKPFEDRLKIVEAQLKAIEEPANAAIAAIERQQQILADELSRGNTEAATMIRQLDAQRQAIERNVEAEKARVDNAKIQVALAKSLQAEERAKLEIRKAELGTNKEIAKVAQKTAKATGIKAPKIPTGGGGGAMDAPQAATGAGMPIQQGQTDVDRLFAQGGMAFQQGFEGQLDPSLMGQMEEARSAQQSAFEQIKTANPVDAIANKFKGLGSKIQGVISSALAGIGQWLDIHLIQPIATGAANAVAWLTDGQLAGSLPNMLANFSLDDIALFETISTFMDTQIAQPFRDKFVEIIGLFNDPARVGGIANFFANVMAKGLTHVLGIGDLWEVFSLFIQDNVSTPMLDKIRELFAFEGEGSLISPFVTIGGSMLEAAGDLGAVVRSMFLGFTNWVFGNTDDGGFPGIVGALLEQVGRIPTGIWAGLQGIGRLTWDVFVAPFIHAINYVLEQINSFFAKITGSGLAGLAEAFNFSIPDISLSLLPTGAPASLTNVPPPPNSGGAALMSLPGGRKGGVFSEGALNVGEEGRETIMAAKPFAIFTTQFREAMNIFATTVNTLSTIMMRTQMSGNVDNSMTDNSINISQNGSRRSAAQDAAYLAALRQGR